MTKRKRHPRRKPPSLIQQTNNLPAAELDIVIPIYGRPELLKPCLAAVEATCFGLNYRLILVDDKSPEPDEMTAIYAALPPSATLIQNPENQGFPGSANIGVAAGQAQAILILNTDVVVKSGAITTMLETLWDNPKNLPTNPHFDTDDYKDASAGIVAPKLVFAENSPHPDTTPGHIQHAGMAFNISGLPIHICVNWSADHPKVNRRKSVQIVTGACLMTRRELWNASMANYQKKGDTTRGAFNEVYGRGTFEDIEFCLAARGGGFKVIYEPNAVASHLVGGSSALQNQGYNLERNTSIFKARCGLLILWDEWIFW